MLPQEPTLQKPPFGAAFLCPAANPSDCEGQRKFELSPGFARGFDPPGAE